MDGYRAAHPVRFDRLVRDALLTLPAPLLDHLQQVEVQVAEVPPADPFATGEDAVVLATYQVPAGGRQAPRTGRDRLVLYRRPIEARSRSKAELLALVQEVVVHEVAHHLGLDDDGLEELGWG